MRFSTIILGSAFLVASTVLAAPQWVTNERRTELEETDSLFRRALPLHCASHNNQIMCDTTHECLSSSGSPTRKPHAQGPANAFCATACSCRQPLGEISGNSQKTSARRPASRSPSPARHRRDEVDEIETLFRRALPLQCASHNNQVICDTTHECLSSSGAPTRKPHAQGPANAFCTTACSCRQPLGEISGNSQKTSARRPASRSPSPARHRRDEVDEIETLFRRAHPLQCASHNNQVICDTTHECLSTSGSPTRKPHAQGPANAFCTTACSCRQPLGEISGNSQKTSARRPASRSPSPARHRR